MINCHQIKPAFSSENTKYWHCPCLFNWEFYAYTQETIRFRGYCTLDPIVAGELIISSKLLSQLNHEKLAKVYNKSSYIRELILDLITYGEIFSHRICHEKKDKKTYHYLFEANLDPLLVA